MTPLDMYDEYPEEMVKYLKNYGWNFNYKACEFAIKKFNKDGFVALTKDKVDELLRKENIVLKNDLMYNSVYIANLAKAYYFGSSLTTDPLMAKFIRDNIENFDSDTHFVLWYAYMCHSGNAIPWLEIL